MPPARPPPVAQLRARRRSPLRRFCCGPKTCSGRRPRRPICRWAVARRICTWAINLWAKQGGDAEADATNAAIERALAEPAALDGLDVLARQRAAETTRRMLSVLLAPPWFQTAAVLDHARLYFADFHPAERTYEDVTLIDELRGAAAGLRDYYCFVLLDFVSANRAIQNEAVRAALQLAERLGWKERFAELLQEELGLRKKQLEKLSETVEPPANRRSLSP